MNETLAKTLFPVEKVAGNNIKIKITYRSCRRWMHSGRNITYECGVSQSVLYEVLNAVPDDVLKRKCLFNGEITFHSAFKKDTEKVVLLN